VGSSLPTVGSEASCERWKISLGRGIDMNESQEAKERTQRLERLIEKLRFGLRLANQTGEILEKELAELSECIEGFEDRGHQIHRLEKDLADARAEIARLKEATRHCHIAYCELRKSKAALEEASHE